MKDWQFNILFFIASGGAVFLLIAPVFHLDTGGPASATGVGGILTFILTQRIENKKDRDKENDVAS